MKHLEITELPTDSQGIFHGLRQPLVRVYNRSRDYPYKMTALKNLLKFMYNRCVAFEKARDELIAEQEKAANSAAESQKPLIQKTKETK